MLSCSGVQDRRRIQIARCNCSGIHHNIKTAISAVLHSRRKTEHDRFRIQKTNIYPNINRIRFDVHSFMLSSSSANTTQSYYNNHSLLIISLFINIAIINSKHDAMNTTNRQQVSAAIYSLSAEHSNLIRKTTVETSAASAFSISYGR